jgi:hypothetical protein
VAQQHALNRQQRRNRPAKVHAMRMMAWDPKMKKKIQKKKILMRKKVIQA